MEKQIISKELTLNISHNKVCIVDVNLDELWSTQFKKPGIDSAPTTFYISPYYDLSFQERDDPTVTRLLEPFLADLINNIMYVNPDKYNMIYYANMHYYGENTIANLKYWYHLYSNAITTHSESTHTTPVSILRMTITSLSIGINDITEIMTWLKEQGFVCVHKIKNWSNSRLDIIMTNGTFNKYMDSNKSFYNLVESEIDRFI